MDTVTINSKYVHITDGTVNVSVYETDMAWLAIFVESLDEEGYPDTEVLSVNLAAYCPAPPEGHFYVKDYGPHEGLAEALKVAGFATPVEVMYYGPFNSTFILMKLGVE